MTDREAQDRLQLAREVLAQAMGQPSRGAREEGERGLREEAPRGAREEQPRVVSEEQPRGARESEDQPGPESDRDADPYAVARAIVLRQLGIAPRSRAQLERKLAQRGCDPGVAGQVLDRMAEVGLVDDAAFAALLVQSRQRTKGVSGIALRAELREKGIADEIAEEAIGGLDEETERARAEELVDKRIRTMGGLAPDVQARRLAGMLARKGYSSGTVYAVVREAIARAPEHQRD